MIWSYRMARVLAAPIINDEMRVSTKARALMPATIGRWAKFAANAVVLQNAAAEAIACGIPAQIRLPHNASADSLT